MESLEPCTISWCSSCVLSNTGTDTEVKRADWTTCYWGGLLKRSTSEASKQVGCVIEATKPASSLVVFVVIDLLVIAEQLVLGHW